MLLLLLLGVRIRLEVGAARNLEIKMEGYIWLVARVAGGGRAELIEGGVELLVGMGAFQLVSGRHIDGVMLDERGHRFDQMRAF